MKRLLLALSLLVGAAAFASAEDVRQRVTFEETDGAPSVRPLVVKVATGTLTDNGDGSVTLQTGASGGGGGLTTVAPSNLAGTIPGPGQIPVGNAGGADTFDAMTPITTFYFEQARETPRFVQSAANNAFIVDAATNPAYGLMAFSNSVSSESNCGYFPMPAVRDYNLSVDFRLDEFRVVNGTGTDSGAQRYVVGVASKTAGKTWLTETYTQQVNVDMAGSLGSVSGEERALATNPTLTNWSSVIASGVPWCVKVCRDGDDSTNDASSTDSRFSMITIRAGNTVP